MFKLKQGITLVAVFICKNNIPLISPWNLLFDFEVEVLSQQ